MAIPTGGGGGPGIPLGAIIGTGMAGLDAEDMGTGSIPGCSGPSFALAFCCALAREPASMISFSFSANDSSALGSILQKNPLTFFCWPVSFTIRSTSASRRDLTNPGLDDRLCLTEDCAAVRLSCEQSIIDLPPNHTHHSSGTTRAFPVSSSRSR